MMMMVTRSRWILAAMMATAVVGCSVTRGGKCKTCEQGAVYPPTGSYDMLQPQYSEPPALPAPTPIPVPPATDPNVPPAPPPPLGARVPATLQGIRYSTTDFFHNANNNVRAMFTR